MSDGLSPQLEFNAARQAVMGAESQNLQPTKEQLDRLAKATAALEAATKE